MNNSVLKNAGWIIGCKIIQSIINFAIGLLAVRYLGPSNYGSLTYVMSVVAFVVPVMQLGLRQTLVKEFVQSPDREGEILGTALVLNLISSVLCMLGCIAFVAIANAGEKETLLVCVLYSFTLLFQATEMTQYWFQSKLLSKYPSIAGLCAYIVAALYKTYLLITRKGVLLFALTNSLEYFLISVFLIVIYNKIGNQRLSMNLKTGREILSRSKYYIIPNLMVMVFQHTDRIMIKLMVGEAETGFYSAAITCIGISNFVFAAIIDSSRPVILEERVRKQESYERRMIQLYSIITCLSLLQSIGMTVLAKPIVHVLYGDAYAKTAAILSVAVWFVTFAYYGSVRNIWILAEGKQKYLLGINIAGATLNILLNYVLIPVWGGIGAAAASLVTQFFTNVVIGFIFPPIRRNNDLLLKSLNPMVMIGILHTAVFPKLKQLMKRD